jgi:hypothetical protein
MKTPIHPYQRTLILFVLLVLVLVSVRECHLACVALGKHEGLVYTILLASAYFTLIFWKIFLPSAEQDSKYLWFLRILTVTLSLIPQILTSPSILAIATLVTLEALIDVWLTIMEKRKRRGRRRGPPRKKPLPRRPPDVTGT